MPELDNLLVFFQQYGLVLSIIAVVGIVGLGLMKHFGAFKNVQEKYRHVMYMAISVGFSIVASAVYLAIINQFTVDNILAIALAVYGLNQAFYSVFKSISFDDLMVKLLDWIRGLMTKKTPSVEERQAEEKAAEEAKGAANE